MNLDATYWEERYRKNEIGWDLGVISTPLKFYIDQLKDKNIKILIPGAGNAHEAEYLFNNGFANVFIVDFAKSALENFSEKNPDFPKNQLICSDFFELEGQFELIFEQTFFCAILPELRINYVLKMQQLLVKEGKLVGVLFNRNFVEGPPFSGDLKEYLELFVPSFEKVIMEDCYNSIGPRKGSELFIKCIK